MGRATHASEGTSTGEAIESMNTQNIARTHFKAHNGKCYVVTNLYENDPTATTNDILILPGTGLHLASELGASGDYRVQIYEGASVSANGTTLMAYNCNRFSSNSTAAQFFTAPTLNTTGTAIFEDIIFAGGFFFISGAGTGDTPSARGPELILDSTQKYLVRMTNISGATASSALKIGYYE